MPASVALVAAALLALTPVPSALAAFPGANGSIAFTKRVSDGARSSTTSAQLEIFTMDSIGFLPLNRTATLDRDEEDAAFSADGLKIAYADTDDDEIYVMPADGCPVPESAPCPAPLTDSGETISTDPDYSPAFSRNGRRVVFVSRRTGTRELYTMDALDRDGDGNGDGLRRLTTTDTNTPPGCCDEASPVFSPDGTKIAFTRGVAPSDIMLMNADGSCEEKLVANAEDPAWSPDGTKLAFTRRESGTARVHVANVTIADGCAQPSSSASAVNLSDHPSRGPLVFPDSEPSFSPAGDQIAFTRLWSSDSDNLQSPSSLAREIHTMNVDGSGQANRTNYKRDDFAADWGVEPGTAAPPAVADLELRFDHGAPPGQGDRPDPAATGEDLTYTIRIRNEGPGTAAGATVTDVLPAPARSSSTTGA